MKTTDRNGINKMHTRAPHIQRKMSLKRGASQYENK